MLAKGGDRRRPPGAGTVGPVRGAGSPEVRARRSAARLIATGTLPRWDWRRPAAAGIAAAIAAAWLGLALLGVATLVWAHPVWWVAGVALVAGAVALRPRRQRPDGDWQDPGSADPVTDRIAVRSPAVDAALAALAAAAGARPPVAVEVTLSPDIVLTGRRVLLVGWPLWALLDDGARRAAVVHELGHERFRDPRWTGPAAFAARWLAQWSAQLGGTVRGSALDRPADELVMFDPLTARRITGVSVHGPTLVRSSGNLAAAVLAAAVRAVARGLDRLTFVPHVRAELLADALAVRVAGPDGVRALLAALPLRRRAGQSARQALRRTDGVGVTRTVAEHLAALPDRERVALDAAVAAEPVRTGQAHLPVRLRRDLVDRLAPASIGGTARSTEPQGPVPDETTWRPATADLAAAFARLEAGLRVEPRAGPTRRRPGHT